MKAVSQLPLDETKRLPVFAEEITGNPHAFDKESKLVTALQLIRSTELNIEFENVKVTEEETELLYEFGILRDDLLNFVTVHGLLAERNGEVVKSWFYSCEEKMVRNVPLREIQTISKIYPQTGKSVFVVENSGVCSSILDKKSNSLPIPIVCTHGQVKLAGLLLIQKLVESGCKIYYSGDFDPEGISIAYRLRSKYGNKVHYWRYSVGDYQQALSTVDITERVQMLQSIDDEDLEPLINELYKVKKAGYQEKLINSICKDIEETMNN
jgi:uncharacterized protein (TIGR02679 family)